MPGVIAGVGPGRLDNSGLALASVARWAPDEALSGEMASSVTKAVLCRPLPLGAIAVLLVNDHVLKGAGILSPGLTGKLSDVGGLFFFPLLLLALSEYVHPARRPARRLVVCAGLTVVAFSAIKLSATVNGWAAPVWGPHVMDATDLWALPAALAAVVWGRRELARPREGSRPWLSRLVMMGACLATVATPRPLRVRNYPAWQIESLGARQLDCARVDQWVVKSGKTGVGVTLEASADEACTLEIVSARMVVGGAWHAASQLPPRLQLHTQKTHVYLVFPFDNEAAWNAGQRSGRLELLLAVRQRHELTLAMDHRFSGFHRLDRDEHAPVDAGGPRLRRAVDPDAGHVAAPVQPTFAEPPAEAQ